MGTTGQQQTLRRLDKPVQRRQTIRLEDYQLLFDRLNPDGSGSLKAIVQKLNDEGVLNPSGKGQWQHVQVARLYRRLAA